MDNQKLIHESAFMTATVLLATLGGCLRDDERNDAFWEFYRIGKAAIEAYSIQRNREIERNPCLN